MDWCSPERTLVPTLATGFWPTTLVDLFSVASAAAAILAIAVAAYWFIRRRQRYPRASLEHEVYARPLLGNHSLVRATVRVINLGNVLIELKSAEVWLQQLSPCPPLVEEQLPRDDPHREEGELPWSVLDEVKYPFSAIAREIEPQETEELYVDFIVDGSIEVILLNSYLKNMAKRQWGRLFVRSREIGWNKTTHHTLRASD